MKQKYQKKIGIFRNCFLLLLLAILGCQSYLHGQTRSNPLDTESLFDYEAVGTPATTALIQNIVYPVNYSTGLPEIKIQLYEVKNGDVTLPIYLTYHASGIKLSDVAGWTGLGWNLVAEPMITRTIRGYEDNPKTRTCSFDKDAYNRQSYVYTMATEGNLEYPDEYYYRLPGKQGMFMYSMEPKDTTRQFLPIPYENIRIDWMNTFFKIVDDNGTIYKFNGGTESGGADGKVVGWKASSLVASNRKDSISFVYDTSVLSYDVKVHNDYMVVRDKINSSLCTHTKRKECMEVCDYLPDEWMLNPIIYSTVNNQTKTYQYNETEKELVPDWDDSFYSSSNRILHTHTQPLSEIRFSQGKLVFTKEQNRPRLQKITVYDLAGNNVKEIRFNYMTNNSKWIHRYYLEGIEITDEEGKILENYRFGYYKHDLLPQPGDRSIDYWGYFNGVYRSDDETLIPGQMIDARRGVGSSESSDIDINIGSLLSREADEKYMMCGVLDEITYPTGSTDKFVYEAHRYVAANKKVRIAGGLRIKQIVTKNKDREMKIRTFKYGIGEDGNGNSLIDDYFNYFMLDQALYLGDPLTVWYGHGTLYFAPYYDFYISARQRTFFSNPIWSVTYDGGSPVMYDCVTEYNGTPENNSGKTVYQYAVKSPDYFPVGYNTIQRNLHDGWQYGHLTNKTMYKNDMGMYKPLESIENFYSSSKKNFGNILIGEAASNVVIRKAVSGFIPGEIMYDIDYARTTIKVGAKLLLKSYHNTYTDEGTVSSIMEYEYGDPSTVFPTCIIETASDGTNRTTTLTYPYTNRNVYPYTEMTERNILNPVVKKEYVYNGSYVGIETPFIKTSDNVYTPSSLIFRRDSLDSGDVRATYLYDDHGRIRQETKDDKETVAYLYGYKNQNIIVRVENATYAEVAAALGGENTVKALADASTLSSYEIRRINNLRFLLPASHVTTYTYEPLVGVASVTDPLGMTTGFEYDEGGRLKQIYILKDDKKEVVERYEYNYANLQKTE